MVRAPPDVRAAGRNARFAVASVVTDPTALPPRGATTAELERWQAAERERRAAEIGAWEHRNRRIWINGVLQIVLIEWIAVLLMLWSFSTTSVTAGTLAFWAALGLGDGGFLFLFVRTWRLAEGGSRG